MPPKPKPPRLKGIHSALVIANGRPPSQRLLNRLVSETGIVVCADGGANAAVRAGIRPRLIIGDLDSVMPETLRILRRVPVRRVNDQTSTDLEKAIRWLLGQGIKDIVIAGATGGRLDHIAGNLHVIGKFASRAHLRVVEEHGELLPVGRRRVFLIPVGSTISLIPLSRCSGVSTRGLKWELRHATLELGRRDGTSNEVVSSPVQISVQRGTLLTYLVHTTDRRRQ